MTAPYLAVVCPECGAIRLASSHHEMASCYQCPAMIDLDSCRIIAESDDRDVVVQAMTERRKARQESEA